jgi:hypothetical protein
MAVIASALVLVSVGCRTVPIYTVDNSPIDMDSKHSLKQVKKAIITAGATLGWKMKSTEKGHLVGTLLLRKHVATVDITFNEKSYSIKYKDSQNLSYDGSLIHSNYNSWVQNLDRNIQVQLSAM